MASLFQWPPQEGRFGKCSERCAKWLPAQPQAHRRSLSRPCQGSRCPRPWELELHTKTKHEILRYFLEAWFPILRRRSGRVLFIDGFASPGIFI